MSEKEPRRALKGPATVKAAHGDALTVAGEFIVFLAEAT
jgi:hypothetical protein